MSRTAVENRLWYGQNDLDEFWNVNVKKVRFQIKYLHSWFVHYYLRDPEEADQFPLHSVSRPMSPKHDATRHYWQSHCLPYRKRGDPKIEIVIPCTEKNSFKIYSIRKKVSLWIIQWQATKGRAVTQKVLHNDWVYSKNHSKFLPRQNLHNCLDLVALK